MLTPSSTYRQEPQPWYMHAILRSLLGFMAFVQKHLLLPRWGMGSLIALDLPAVNANTGKVERTHPPWFQPRPWYKPEPRNSLEALVMRVAVWAGWYECAPGSQWKSEGYYLDEMVSASCGNIRNEVLTPERSIGSSEVRER